MTNLFFLLKSQNALAGSAVSSTSVGVNMNGFDAVLNASPVVQFVLLILISLSLVCWAIGFVKYREFRSLFQANSNFLEAFWSASSLEALHEKMDSYRDSSLARIFNAGYSELRKLTDGQSGRSDKSLQQLSGGDNLDRALRRAMELEMSRLEARLTVLATTGSTGPFIGLFGTVWGIMGSFHKIGAMGSASLAVVAPGISEALIATAIGLAAAIPAVVMYNNFLNIVKRNFLKEG